MKMWEGLPCERKACRLQANGHQSSLVYQPQVYDRDGNPLPMPNLNTVWSDVSCSVCKRRWSIMQKPDQPAIWTLQAGK